MSKRSMDIQGGADRYGGASGADTPDDAPVRANAAQLARRKIAPIKGRVTRAKSPVKTGPLFGDGFGQGQQDMSSSQQPSFSFGQNGTTPGAANGFSFGQSQQPATNGFTFGHSQPAASSSFTFGQNGSSQSTGFSFNAPSSSVSFPPVAASNPFAKTSEPTNGFSNGFQGSIFNIPSTQATTTNGFSFSSGTPSSSAQDREAEKRIIQEREPYLEPAQQKQLEEIVGRYLLDVSWWSRSCSAQQIADENQSPNLYQQDPLDMLPADALTQVAKLLRDLPSRPSAPKNVLSLFVKPYRGKSQKAWVTDAEREAFMSTAGKLAPEQQTKVAQFVRINVDTLKGKPDNELPGLAQLPNDVQYEMIQLAQSLSQAASTPVAPKPSAKISDDALNGDDRPHIEDTNTPTKANPFASIKKSPAIAPAPKMPAFSFSSASAPSEPKKPSAPVFSFQSPSKTADTTSPVNGTLSAAAGVPAKASEEAPANPFATISRPASAPSDAPIASSAGQGPASNAAFNFGQVGTGKGDGPQASTPAKPTFAFGQTSQTPPASSSNVSNFGSTAAPPATAPVQKTIPPFSFSTQPVTAKPSFVTPPQSVTQQSPPTQPPPPPSKSHAVGKNSEPARGLPGAGVTFDDKRLRQILQKIAVLQGSFREAIADWDIYKDWSTAAKFYLIEYGKLKSALDEEETAIDRGERALTKTAHQSQAADPKASPAISHASTGNTPGRDVPSTGNTPGRDAASTGNRPAPVKPQEPAKPSTAKASPFQLSSPQKPLTATASVFSSILDAPDKGNSATNGPPAVPSAPAQAASPFQFKLPTTNNSAPSAPSAPSSPFKFTPPTANNTAPSAAPAAASPFKFKPPTTSNSAQTQATNGESTGWKPPAMGQALPQPAVKTPSFTVPKFGGSTAGTNNFMSAFGAQAKKEAAKEKAKRKAEDFDSDEDDEAEWERQDREKQEEKKRKLNEQANKVMKNVNGKFVLVDKEDESKDAPATASERSTAQTESPADNVANTNAETSSAMPSAQPAATPATPAKAGLSLFDRIGQNSDGTLQKEEKPASQPAFKFGASTPPTNQTWKPETPITFAAAPETLGSTTPTGSPAKSMFSFATKMNGSAAPPAVPATPKWTFGKPSTTTDSGNEESVFGTTKKTFEPPKFVFGTSAVKPAASTTSFFSNAATIESPSKPPTGGFTGFKFGAPSTAAADSSLNTPSIVASPATSRATTPGMTGDDGSTAANTDNEDAAATVGDAAPPEEQRDLTSLSAEEQRTEDVLFEGKARCRKFVRGTADPWENKGIGIIRLLKNKETGNARVLMRLAPGGQLVINSNVMKEDGMYSKLNEKVVKVVFADEGGLSTYSLQFGKAEAATSLLGKISGVNS